MPKSNLMVSKSLLEEVLFHRGDVKILRVDDHSAHSVMVLIEGKEVPDSLTCCATCYQDYDEKRDTWRLRWEFDAL